MNRLTLLLTIALLSLTSSCRAQQTNREMSKQVNNLENTFDKRKLEGVRGGISFMLNDSTEVFQRRSDNFFVETITFNYPCRNRQLQRTYHLDNGRLRSETAIHFSEPVGVRRYFDYSGQLVKEIDQDAPFPFSIEDVRSLVKEVTDIDIFNTDFGVRLQRYSREVGVGGYFIDWFEFKREVNSLYRVDIELIGRRGSFHNLLIDGETGKILRHEFKEFELEPVNLLEDPTYRYKFERHLHPLPKETSLLLSDEELAEYNATNKKKGFWESMFD